MANKWILTQNEKKTEYTGFEEAVRHFRSVIAKKYNDMDDDFSTYLIDGGKFLLLRGGPIALRTKSLLSIVGLGIC